MSADASECHLDTPLASSRLFEIWKSFLTGISFAKNQAFQICFLLKGVGQVSEHSWCCLNHPQPTQSCIWLNKQKKEISLSIKAPLPILVLKGDFGRDAES